MPRQTGALGLAVEKTRKPDLPTSPPVPGFQSCLIVAIQRCLTKYIN